MIEQPTREQLLHLVDRARRGVALPAEHDQLAAGVSAMADALAEQRTTTVETLDASHVTLRRYRKRAERAEAERDRVQQAACRTAENLRHAEQRAERAEAIIARVRQMADYWEQQLPDVIRTPAVVSALRAATDQVQQPTA